MPPARRSIKLPEEIADLICSLHPHLKRKVRAAFKIILDDPLSGKALKDELMGLRSFRVSKIRIIYRTTKQEVNPIIKGILIHFWLAYVHPFMDGNAPCKRTGCHLPDCTY